MITQGLCCLFCHTLTSVWLYVKWYILFFFILPGGVTSRLIRLGPACLPSERTHSEGCVCLLGLGLLCNPRQLVAEWSLWTSFPPLCPPAFWGQNVILSVIENKVKCTATLSLSLLFSLFVHHILPMKSTLKCLRCPHKSYPAVKVTHSGVISTPTKCPLLFNHLFSILKLYFTVSALLKLWQTLQDFFFLFKKTAVFSDQIIPSIHLLHFWLYCHYISKWSITSMCYV